MYAFLLVIHTLLALGIVVFVLLQRSDNEGFGLSGGGSGLISGQAKANFFTRTTGILAALFMLTSLILTVMLNSKHDDSIVDRITTHSPVIAPQNADPATDATGAETPAQPKAADVPLAE